MNPLDIRAWWTHSTKPVRLQFWFFVFAITFYHLLPPSSLYQHLNGEGDWVSKRQASEVLITESNPSTKPVIPFSTLPIYTWCTHERIRQSDILVFFPSRRKTYPLLVPWKNSFQWLCFIDLEEWLPILCEWEPLRVRKAIPLEVALPIFFQFLFFALFDFPLHSTYPHSHPASPTLCEPNVDSELAASTAWLAPTCGQETLGRGEWVTSLYISR